MIDNKPITLYRTTINRGISITKLEIFPVGSISWYMIVIFWSSIFSTYSKSSLENIVLNPRMLQKPVG
jgi:hypothetical protein